MQIQTNFRKLLEQELKKISTQNKIQVFEQNNTWNINIKNLEIIIPKINNSKRRNNIITNK